MRRGFASVSQDALRILYLENYDVFADVVVEAFLHSHTVVVRHTAEAALAALRSCTFDVVLLDYDLDDCKGDAVLERFRSAGVSTPVVAVSARPEGNRRLLAAGAIAACPKGQFHQIGAVLHRVVPAR